MNSEVSNNCIEYLLHSHRDGEITHSQKNPQHKQDMNNWNWGAIKSWYLCWGFRKSKVGCSFLPVKFKSTKKEEQSRCWNGWAKGCGYHQDKIIMNKDKVQAPSANIIKKNSLVECQVDRSPNLKILECIHAITYCNLGLFKLGT